ncbi:MAG: HD domain-containing phosphohydrolase [Actinomycetota bacterium]
MLAAEPGREEILSGQETEVALRAIADFVDLKSPFMLGHSPGVAALAKRAAQAHGLDDRSGRELSWAGFPHDIGMVGLSVSVWDHPRPLTQDAWERLRLHAYYNERVLARSQLAESAARIASMHHERIDGSGYHRGCKGGEQPVAARILAAADSYRAMTEPRAHRAALSADEARAALETECRSKRLDSDAVAAVLTAVGQPVSIRRGNTGRLTAREAEVLVLIARGLATKQVARGLGISAKTADNHIQNIYSKIGVSTRASAALWAVQKGLLPPS